MEMPPITAFMGADNPPTDQGQGAPAPTPNVEAGIPSVPVPSPTPIPQEAFQQPMTQQAIQELMQRLQPQAPPNHGQQVLKSLLPAIMAIVTGIRGQGAYGAAQGIAQSNAAAANAADRDALAKDRISQAIQRLQAEQSRQLTMQRYVQAEADRQRTMARLEKAQADNQAKADAAAKDRKDRENQALVSSTLHELAQGGYFDQLNDAIDKGNEPAMLNGAVPAAIAGVDPKYQTMGDVLKEFAVQDPVTHHYFYGKTTEKPAKEYAPLSEADYAITYARDVFHTTVDQLTTSQKNEVMKEYGKNRPSLVVPEDVPLSDDAIKMYAEMLRKTTTMAYNGYGKAAVIDKRKISNMAASMGPVDLADAKATYTAYKASLDKLEPQYNALNAFTQNEKRNWQVFLDQAKKVIDSGSPWANEPLRNISRDALGDTDVAAFDAARGLALPGIARIISSPNLTGALSDTARSEINGISSSSATLRQIYRVGDVLMQDMNNRPQSLKDQIQYLQNEIRKPAGTDINSGAPAGAAPPAMMGDDGSVFRVQ